MAHAKVPLQKRVIVWLSSVVLGVCAYFVFATVLTVGPAAEQAKVRGQIEGLVTESLGRQADLADVDAEAAAGRTRAAASHLVDLHRRELALSDEVRAKSAWAAIIGIVAGVGCFALCWLCWLRQRAGESGAAPPAAAAGTGA